MKIKKLIAILSTGVMLSTACFSVNAADHKYNQYGGHKITSTIGFLGSTTWNGLDSRRTENIPSGDSFGELWSERPIGKSNRVRTKYSNLQSNIKHSCGVKKASGDDYVHWSPDVKATNAISPDIKDSGYTEYWYLYLCN